MYCLFISNQMAQLFLDKAYNISPAAVWWPHTYEKVWKRTTFSCQLLFQMFFAGLHNS